MFYLFSDIKTLDILIGLKYIDFEFFHSRLLKNFLMILPKRNLSSDVTKFLHCESYIRLSITRFNYVLLISIFESSVM
jgi:hypothetical protein